MRLLEPVSPTRPQGASLLAFGAGLLLLALWGLAADVRWISQPFYAYAWWGYIFLLDGFCIVRRRSSLLTTRRPLFPILCVSSVTFWFLFEALNLRFRNWYYVGTFRLESTAEVIGSGVFVFVAFATVFVGIFETFDALGAARVLQAKKRPEKPARPMATWIPWFVQGVGAAMAIAAIASPYYLAPLIWGSFTLLLDPINYRRGRRSLLRDLESGDGAGVLRLLLAGLICGLVWESFNFIAPQKWIYTVRGLENLKLFEMPLLGFLGFPALALDCVTGFALLSGWCLGNVAWEHQDDLLAPPRDPRPVSHRPFWLSLPLQMAFCGAIASFIITQSVGSVRLDLRDLSLRSSEITALNEAGVDWPRQLGAALSDSSRRQDLADQFDWSPDHVELLLREVELFTHKGIGHVFGSALQSAGVETVDQLATWEPEALHAKLEGLLPPPSLDWIRVWVLAARDRGIWLQASGPTASSATP